MSATAMPVGLLPESVDVRRILQNEAVALAFQPIVDLTTRAVVAVETLARFPDFETPMPVLRAAEPSGLGGEIEALVVRRALAERNRVPSGILLTVNVAPTRLLMDPVRSLLLTADLSGVMLELTEHAMPPAPEELRPVISQLRERGALIALDDTGSGYQGLQQIAELRPDWVKIDRALVTGAATDPVRRASLQMFSRVSRRAGAVAVGEGVESETDLATLREVGVQLAQGYLFGAPSAHLHHLADD